MFGRRMKKGFTLAELLIVVAIIAVLVAIAVPVFRGSLAKAEEAVCMANRRSLYAQIVTEHLLTDRPCAAIFAEYVGGAGKCPAGGTFSWRDEGNTGVVVCDHHDGGGSGGSGGSSGSGSSGIPALHTTPGLTAATLVPGTVVRDETGAVVIFSGMWGTQNAYSTGAKAAELAAQFPSDAKLVDPSDIKDASFTGTLKVGDLYYDAPTGTFYYVKYVNSETWPASGWLELFQ
jgi:prepilin-type N-terminal cleavage/methylation domain-containing protein